MKLLYKLDVTEDSRVTARPCDYLKSLPVEQQITAVTEILNRAESEVRNNTGPQTHVAGIGVATAREFLQKLEKICIAHLRRQQQPDRR